VSDARRFERQVRFAPLGPEGQARLERSSVLLVGCGALGGMLAQSLARAGLGRLVLVDRDVVDETNLPRQVLFDERHAREGVPKALAARETLARAGGPTRVDPHVAHVDADNLEQLAQGSDLVLDGTDNLRTRYLVNDWAVREARPWIYGAVVGAEGRVLAVRPGKGPCLRCLFPDPPPAGALATCDTAGVIQPAVGLVASLQAGLALRLLADPEAELVPALYDLDAWTPRLRAIDARRDPACPCCAARASPFLEGAPPKPTLVFCGRNAVQVRGAARPDLALVARRVEGLVTGMRSAAGLLRFDVEGGRLTLFDDGRALVEGTEDERRALALYDRYVGS
jgi:molybdopterin/thiamine biosynthesis adenylyltransferase